METRKSRVLTRQGYRLLRRCSTSLDSYYPGKMGQANKAFLSAESGRFGFHYPLNLFRKLVDSTRTIYNIPTAICSSMEMATCYFGFTCYFLAVRNVSGQRLRPRSRVPEAWRGPPHNKLYGAGPVNSRLVKFNLKLSI